VTWSNDAKTRPPTVPRKRPSTLKRQTLRAPRDALLTRMAPKMRELQERFKQPQQDYSALGPAVSRMIRVSQGLDPVPRKKKRQKSAPVGAPPTYDAHSICNAAEDVAKRGVPDRAAWFYEKLRTELSERHIKQPGDTRLKELAGPVYKRAKRTRRI
jgi:hypothetical protein